MSRKRNGESVKSALSRDIFYTKYVVNGLSMAEIAREYSCSRSFIGGLREQYNIPKQQRWATTEELKDAMVREYLQNIYLELGSDEKIGSLFGVNSKLIGNLRKALGIKTIISGTGRIGELFVVAELKRYFDNVIDKNTTDIHSIYDIDADGLRIEVKTSSIKQDNRWGPDRELWEFNLRKSWRNRAKESETQKEIKPGVFRKLYRETCDIVVLVGINEIGKVGSYFVISSESISDSLQTISIPVKPGTSIYDRYRTNTLESVRFLSPKTGSDFQEVEMPDNDIPFS